MFSPSELIGMRSMVPDLKTVSYFSRQVPGDGFAAASQVTQAERRWPSRKDRESQNAQIRSADLVWHLWKDKLGSISPKEGDKIEFGTEKWFVSVVIEELIGQRFRLFCRKGV